MVRTLILAGVAVALWTGTALPAEAQGTGRVYRGLFGSGLQGLDQSLTFDSSLGGGLDTNVISAEPLVPGDPEVRSRASGTFGQVVMGLNYNLDLSRVTLHARGGGNVSHYNARVRPVIKTYAGSAGGTAPLWSGAMLSMNYSMTYRPFYYLPWLTGVAGAEAVAGPAPEIDETAGAFVEYHTNANGMASLTQRLTTRVHLSASYGFQQSNSNSGVRDLDGQNGSASMGFNITKGLSLNLGYGFTEAGYTGQSYRARNIIAGLNFNRGLSLTRSTNLTFSTGSNAVTDTNQTYYHINANVALTHQMGRSWTASLLYNRSVSFDEAFRTPVPYDGVTIGVRGMFSRQLDFNASLGTVIGALGLAPGSNGFETYYARSGVLWGLSRMFGVGLDYTYYHYGFDSQVLLPPGLVRQADRHHVRAFVTMRAALFKGRNRGGR